MIESSLYTADIPDELGGLRLDQALAELFPEFSRSRLQDWIKSGCVQVNGKALRAKDKVMGGEAVELRAELQDSGDDQPQDIPLDVVYEDASLIIVNKPAGLVVHPAAGNWDGTLVNALLHYAPELAAVPRAGIVHRLDKDTSGLLMVARTLQAHKVLVEQLQARDIEREYLAVVQGTMTAGGTVDAPLGRHPVDRKRHAVREDGKPAVTHYRVLERYPHHTLVRLKLETGRTHQIRVHMAHIHYSLVGDPVYGRLRLPAGAGPDLTETLRGFRRQALHATRLALAHPEHGDLCEWEAPMPDDMSALVDALRRAQEEGGAL
ncbi:23S rRNA pseudouridine(1911/1915/1917) synthase RluD [Methylogaea oryzae]|uniref:Pseudouridine synthase n=1 Tax=Methylogaea oryzae TaxID=1295382 RepID=A0A8D5AI88_9GAMM|nr:23S rRNA pseudouridine(1911/1915/1917) synthase RluD [Methylogaea oryzae]BBL71096.1 ribosomal large subunit pseudouridine synthase D [Methylogaea oryzae]